MKFKQKTRSKKSPHLALALMEGTHKTSFIITKSFAKDLLKEFSNLYKIQNFRMEIYNSWERDSRFF